MFCPSCGVKNEGAPLKCFVCRKVLPTGNAEPKRDERPRVAHRAAPTTAFASVGDRMLALILDRVFLGALAGAGAIGIALQWPSLFDRLPSMPWLAVVIASIATLLILAYHIVLEGSFGTTVGKAILGLYVRSNADRGSFAGAALRNALRLIDALGMYALAFLVSVFSKRKQRIGDYVSQSVVVVDTIHPAARAGLLLLFAAAVGGFIAYAMYACPECGTDLADRIAAASAAPSRGPLTAGR